MCVSACASNSDDLGCGSKTSGSRSTSPPSATMNGWIAQRGSLPAWPMQAPAPPATNTHTRTGGRHASWVHAALGTTHASGNNATPPLARTSITGSRTAQPRPQTLSAPATKSRPKPSSTELRLARFGFGPLGWHLVHHDAVSSPPAHLTPSPAVACLDADGDCDGPGTGCACASSARCHPPPSVIIIPRLPVSSLVIHTPCCSVPPFITYHPCLNIGFLWRSRLRYNPPYPLHFAPFQSIPDYRHIYLPQSVQRPPAAGLPISHHSLSRGRLSPRSNKHGSASRHCPFLP